MWTTARWLSSSDRSWWGQSAFVAGAAAQFIRAGQDQQRLAQILHVEVRVDGCREPRVRVTEQILGVHEPDTRATDARGKGVPQCVNVDCRVGEKSGRYE